MNAFISRLLIVTSISATLYLIYKRRKPMKKKRILHVKGFAQHVNFKELQKETQFAIDFMKKYQPNEIIWDGDAFSINSFTYILSEFAKKVENLDEITFIMYVPKGMSKSEAIASTNDFIKQLARGYAETTQAWKELFPHLVIKETNIDPELFEPYTYFKHHGIAALKDSGGSDVIVLGVGPCVKEEILEVPHVNFHIVNIQRFHPVRKELESFDTHFATNVPINIKRIF